MSRPGHGGLTRREMPQSLRCITYEKLGPRFKRNLRERTRRLLRNWERPREGHEFMT